MIAQTKMQVIDPKSGTETFVLVHHVNGKKLINAKDLLKYHVFGYTRRMIEENNIPRYLNTGIPAKRERGMRYFFDLQELQSFDFKAKKQTITAGSDFVIVKNGLKR